MADSNERLVLIPTDGAVLEGILSIPKAACAVVLFAHGSGSSRHSPRNRHVAQELNRLSFATLLMDLLTTDEEALDLRTRRLRFDIELLTRRVVGATDWLVQNPEFRNLRIGYFGSSTGAAAALAAAAERPQFHAGELRESGRMGRAIVGKARVSGSSHRPEREPDEVTIQAFLAHRLHQPSGLI